MTNVVQTVPGDTFKATVTHVASEYRWIKMYVQRDYEMTEHIETYLEGLEPKLSEMPGFMHQSQIPLGTPCFARFTDGKWYRAVASAWPRGDSTLVEVTFIDYGNPEIVSVTDVRLGTDTIFHTSPVAIECFLDEVDLQLVTPQGAEALVDFLKNQLQYVEVGVTVRRLEHVQVACVRPIVSVTMPDGGSLTDVIMQSPLFAVVCTVAAPAIVDAPSFLYHPVEMNTPYQVYVAHVEDMARVFLHLADRDPAPFTDMIQAHCVNPSPLDPSLVREGTVCLARFTEDGLLYRSFVYEYKQGICKVLFVDYGNCELKAPSELLVIPPELLKEEIFTIRCNAMSTGLDKDTFVKLTAEQELTCQFSPADPPSLFNVEFVGLTPNRSAPLTNGLPPGRPQIQIQRLTLESGCRHAMQVTFIESVQVMYAQLREMVNDIEQMSRQLEMESPSLPPLVPADVVPGAAVACRYDGIWYRAEVLKVGPQVEVWIADYGDTATVDLSDLRPLDPKYTLQPAYATKLTLDGFTCSPIASGLVMETLEALVLDAEASVSIVNVLPDGTHSVQIFVGDPPKSVVRALQIALANIDEVRTTKVHTPSVSPVEKLLVMTVMPPRRFFGQFLKVPEGQLDELQAKLSEHYAASAPDPTFRPQPRDHVACRFSEDGAFYRAEVKKAVEGGFDVAYLDYGNEETVSPQDIRPLAPQFGMPPAFGMICELKSGEVSDAMLETEVEVRCCACRDGINVVDFLNSGLRAAGSAPVEAARPVAAAVPPPSKPPVAAPAAVPPPSANMSAFGAPAAGLPVLKLEPRTAEAAKGVFVKLVDDFYCQLVRNDQLLNQITEDLAGVAASQPCLGPAMRKVGSACCALFSEDSLWYRASILQQRPGGATVLFVDYGNVESVDDAQIRQLPPTLASIPGQAVWCRLAGAVVPAGSSPDIAAGRLDEFILEQEFTLKVVANGPDNFHDVDIVLSDGTNIKDLLVEEGLVQASGPPLAVPQPPQPQQQPQPQQVSGYSYPILDPGVGLPCEVSWVLNPGEVYVQQVAAIDALENLMAQMQAHYSGGGEMVAGGVRPGQPCVAKYAEDGRWYRARVTHAKGGRLGVQYVDYGNCEEVPESSVRQIQPKFVALPAQAIRCRIRTVAAPGGGDTWPPIDPNSPLSERLQAVFEGQFRCVPAGYRDGLHLVDLERMGSGPSIVEALVAVGLARDVTAAPRGFAGSEASQGLSTKLRAVLAPGEFSFQAQQYVDVKVTAVVSLSEVWCCLVEGVEPLTEALQKAGEAAPQLRNPVPGEGCVARLPGSNEQGSAGEPLITPWARAVVRSRPSPSKLELFFVDLGGTRVVHHTEVKQIPPELTTQPGQAFQCVLSASFPVDTKELSSKILYKELVLQVDRQLDAAKVAGSLFDTSGGDDVNVLDFFAPPPAPPPVEKEAPPVVEKEAPPPVEKEAPPPVEKEAPPPVEKEPPPMVEKSPPVVEKAPLDQVERAPETNGVAAPPAAPTQPRALHRAQSTHKILPCYPPLSKISGKLAAYVMHTESLSAFYVMLKEQESALEEMAMRLEECYVNAPLPVVPPCAKLPCVAFYPKDGAWYRAKVVRDMNVQFIDYGNVDAVPEIREIAPEFLEIPPFCYKCKLDGAKELAGVAGADVAFKELVADAELELQVLTWGMEVTVRLSKDGADIGALLKEKLAAPSTESQAAPTCHTAEEVVPAPVSADAVPAAPTREGCTVTHVDGLDSFYVLPLARQAELEALGDRLQEVLASGRAHFVDNPNGETLYGALYSMDGLWYRARVEGAAAEGGLKVRFVDYGNVESVQSVALLDAKLEFHSEPFCMECQLAGLKGAAGPSALEKFKELVLDAELQVETVVRGSKPVVRLFAADGTELVTQLPLQRGYTVGEVPLHQKVQVQVSHAESPTDFFVQLVERLDALDTLTEQLLELPPGDGTTVDMSQPCMVFWSDENPYRATVLETSDSAAALVHFVDYGNCDTVEVSGIRHLPSSLVEVPLFAIHCTLDVPEGKLGEEATEELQRLAESEPNSSLLAEFLGERNGRYVVRLLDMGIDVLGKLLKGEDSGGDMSPSNAAQGSASKETAEAAPTSGTGDERDVAVPTVVEAQGPDISETVASSGVEPEGSDGVETVEEAKKTAIGGGSDIPEIKDDELRDEAVEEAEFEAHGDKLNEKENSGEPAADAELPEEGADASLNGQGGVAEELLPPVVEEDALDEDQAGATTAGDLAPEEVEEAAPFEETRTAKDDSREDGETAMVPFEELLPEAPAAAAAPLEEEQTTLEVPTTAEDDSSKDDATVKLPTEESCLDGAAAPLGEEPATFEEDSYDEDVTVVIRTEEPVLELPAGAAPFEEQESEVKVETAVVESAASTHLEDESGATSADGKAPEATADADLASAGAPSVGGSTLEVALKDAVPAGGSTPDSVPEATPVEAPAPEVESKTEVAGDASLFVAEEVPADGSQSRGELDKSPVALESATVGSLPVDEAPACAEVPLELAKGHGDKTEPEQESDTATTEVESALALERPDEGSPREACVPTPADRPVALSEKGEGPSSPQRVGANDSSAAGAVAPVVSGAIGAGGDAAGFKAEPTVSPYPSRRRMPDECVVPGVCTNPELFASPSDEGN